jgi:hypothetical protein
MMTFDDIDPVIEPWSAERQVHLFRRYRDDEVRSWEIVGASGQRSQIWIEIDERGLRVHVWDVGDRRRAFPRDVGTLRGVLDEALVTAKLWVNA